MARKKQNDEVKQEVKPKKRMETSKKLLLAAYTFSGILTLAIVITTFLNIDNSNLTVVASASWAELAIHTSAYSIKAKAENRLKLTQSVVQGLSKIQKFEPEALIQILDSIMKE